MCLRNLLISFTTEYEVTISLRHALTCIQRLLNNVVFVLKKNKNQDTCAILWRLRNWTLKLNISCIHPRHHRL